MPPQKTDLTPETRRDAAGLHLAIASAHGAIDDALPAALPDAPIAALPNIVLDKDAAAPPAAPIWSVVSVLLRYWRAFQERRQRQILRASLNHLSDRELMDIGITRGELDYIAYSQGIDLRERSATTLLWIMSRGAG